jgi:hypothetical protein
MIDISTEQVITYAKATDALPRCRQGKKVHVSTIHRWTTTGFRGTVLESIRVGGTRCTSLEALQRFLEQITARSRADVGAGDTPTMTTPHLRTESQRRRESEAAARRLVEMGA